MKGFFDMEEMPEGSEVPELPGQLAFFPDQCTTHPEGKKQKRTYPELNPLVLNDPHLVSIRICCVLLRLNGSLPEDWLYEMMVVSGHISYFLYADAIGFLIENGSVNEETDAQQKTRYCLTNRGRLCAEKLRQYVPKPFRDQVMLTALRSASRRRALAELSIRYEPDVEGCALCVACRDGGLDMFSIRIHAPSAESAEMLGERILRNPAGFFGKIIDIAMNNEEEDFDLSDN